MGTIEDLIRYRIENEKTVERIAENTMVTEYGEFRVHAYHDVIDNAVHLAVIMGDITRDEPTLVRVHMQNTLGDLLGARTEDYGWPLHDALKRIADEGRGAVVILRWDDEPEALVARIREYHVPDAGEKKAPARPDELRTYGVGAQIIADLGIRKLRVLSAPKIVHGIAGFGLEVVEYVPCELP